MPKISNQVLWGETEAIRVLKADMTGAPNDNFLSDPLKRYFRQSGVALNLNRFILGSAIIFLSVRSF